MVLMMTVPQEAVLVDRYARELFPTIALKEIRVVERIGEGSFSSVYHVRLFEDSKDSSGEFAKKTHQMKLALKRSKDIFSDQLRQDAAECLEREASILSSLPSHENVIKLVYMSPDFWQNPAVGYLIIEKLEKILDIELDLWRAESEKERPSLAFLGRGNTSRANSQRAIERALCIGPEIAGAMEFLHKHHVLYRDLKTENVGFDAMGKVRLFDFGLARFIDADSDERKLTLQVGTPGYMAPEVMSGSDNYGFPVDVYSFAIVLWEIATLGIPFDKFRSFDSLRDHVVKRQGRPSLRLVPDQRLKSLLQACWDCDPNGRPSFSSVASEIRSISI